MSAKKTDVIKVASVDIPSCQVIDSKDNFRPREKWDKKIEFVLSCIGFSVGLGNVWRFPYLCYKNGGGAFLVPYFICLVAGGVPIFFLEVGLGQYMSEGGISAWKICPAFKGIGFGTTIICFLLNIYYIVILAWALHYFFASFALELPWSSCDHDWNSDNCFGFRAEVQNGSGNSTVWPLEVNSSVGRRDAVVEYWENRVLGLTKGVDEVGTLQWELALTLLLAWILVYFCVWKGIKSSGKVVYFTATFPYVMLTVLLVRGVTLPGAVDGLIYYLRPDFTKLLHSQVWIDAGTQIFFSYAIALGCMTALGSYNKFHNNFVKDCIFVCCCNSATSLYAGLAIFSVLGFMAHEQGLPIDKVAESGPGLAFIAYPKAVTQMTASPFWSGLFFFMILILGLDSQFVGVEGFVTAIVDLYPHVLRSGKKREIFIAIVSGISYLIGLTMVTNGGIYVFQLFDYYAASGMVLLWFCFFESVVIAWVYGADRFYDDIQTMVGYRVGPWLKICWKYLTPIVTMGILIFSLLTFEPLTYNKVYRYPAWAQGLGSTLAIISMVTIPGFLIWKILRTPGTTFKERWYNAVQPLLQPHQLEKLPERV